MPSFSQLWNNHPTGGHLPTDPYPCKTATGAPQSSYQCASRLSVCLARSGISLLSFGGGWCGHHNKIHAKAAYPLAYWLKYNQQLPWGKPQQIKNNTQKTAINAAQFAYRKGIVFFSNFWAATAGAPLTDDHIDLWNGSRMTQGYDTYFSRSEEVWFWDIG